MRRLLTTTALAALLFAPLAMAQPTTAPATATPAPAATTAPARPAAAAPAAAPAASRATPATLPAGQFRAEADAKAHCPTDVVVWVNKESKVYHVSGDRYFGKTKVGFYMCQKEANGAGFRAPRTTAHAPAAATPAATSTTAPAAGATPARR